MAHITLLQVNRRIVLEAGLLTAEIAHVIAGTTTGGQGMLVTSLMTCHGSEGTENVARQSHFLSTIHHSRMTNSTSTP